MRQGKNIFYSWQSDLPDTRNLISDALKQCARELNKSEEIVEALRIDQDTKEVAGWPEITTTILRKIDSCDVFVADITPITGPSSQNRVCPNPNVLFELGYALATGMKRMRIVCIINSYYLPSGDIKMLPFDIRGSRPLQYHLAPKDARSIAPGEPDNEKNEIRTQLSKKLNSEILQVLSSVDEYRKRNELRIKPNLVIEGNRFQVVIDCINNTPFQMDYMVKEPSNKIISGVSLGMTPLDPKGKNIIRFAPETLNQPTSGNKKFILYGKFGHIQSESRPVPDLHKFEVHYEFIGERLVETFRKQPEIG